MPPSPVLPKRVTLDDALRLFRSHGLDLIIAEASVSSAEGDLRAAGAIPNPNWTAGGYKAFFQSGLFESDTGWFVGLGDSNALEDTLSGKRHLRRKVARAALEAARMSRVDAERNLAFQVKQQYMQAVLARDTLDFALEVQQSTTRTFELGKIRYEKGAISEADEAVVETAKLEADQAVANSRQALEVAKAGLAFLMGVRGEITTFEVEQDLPKFSVPPALAQATPESLLREALDHRPDLRGQRFQRDRASAQISLSKRLRFPDIGLSLLYAAQGSSSGICPSGTRRDARGQCFNPIDMSTTAPTTPVSPPTLTFSLTGTIPLLYQQQGEIRKAEADFAAQEAQAARLEAQVLADVTSAFSSFHATRELVERMEARLLDRAKRARDLIEVQYQKGAASLLDFLIAQRTYVVINLEYLNDLANYWTAVFHLEQAVGMELTR